MERVLTQEERIRRAEEIYLRRKNREPNIEYKNVAVDRTQEKINNKSKLLKRTFLQIIICLLLYCIFYLIYDTNYTFSDITISKIDEILNYDVNFDYIYKFINEKIVPNFSFKEYTEETTGDNQNEEIHENQEKNEEIEELSEDDAHEEGESIINEESNQEENNKEKEKYSLIVPVYGGYISSKFGERESTSEIVSTNHKGIDIAVASRN